MKFSICQINSSVGALKYNYEKIVKFYKKSISSGSDMIVFPELSITGYPPRDLLFEKKFILVSQPSSITWIVCPRPVKLFVPSVNDCAL